MRSIDGFKCYIKSEFNCDSIYAYVVKVMADLNNGVIDSLTSVIVFITDNYDSVVFDEFMICYEDFLSGNTRVIKKYEAILHDVDFEYVKVRKL